jgi:hypothetical protein
LLAKRIIRAMSRQAAWPSAASASSLLPWASRDERGL